MNKTLFQPNMFVVVVVDVVDVVDVVVVADVVAKLRLDDL